MSMEFTPDEIIVVCMSRQVRDGEIVAQGLATPLAAAAYLLAQRTHAPHLYIASAIGQGLCRTPAPLGLATVESLWLDRTMTSVGFVRAAIDMLPSLRPLEFFRPAQIDPAGNFNNIAFGNNYRRPRLRLPGSGGIPDVTTYIRDIMLYVPRHSRVTFVEKLDFISGLGFHPDRRQGAGPRYLVSDLGQFDFAPESSTGSPVFSSGNERMRLTSFHGRGPSATEIAHIQARTGFRLDISPDVHPTPPPSAEELHLLRTEIDPLGIRRLEGLSGTARRELLHQLLAIEARGP
jgi:glutaconate CoA-transferase subunit B